MSDANRPNRYTFTGRYTDASGVDAVTLGGGNVIVAAPAARRWSSRSCPPPAT